MRPVVFSTSVVAYLSRFSWKIPPPPKVEVDGPPPPPWTVVTGYTGGYFLCVEGEAAERLNYYNWVVVSSC